jgi:hypothetical protein
VAVGVAEGVAVGVAEGVAEGVAVGVAYFFTIGRWFYTYAVLAPPRINKNPLVWDENFGLPFPFLPKILQSYVKKRDLIYATELCVFLINERKVQRKAAQKGLMLITTDVMSKFESLLQISRLKESLNYLPAAKTIPEGFSDNILKFAELSEDIQNAQNESNISNKVSIYSRSLKTLEEYRKSAIWKKDKDSPHFAKVAEKWQQIINKEILTIKKSGKMPLANPFVTGNPVKEKEGTVFIGRQDIVEQIQNEALREVGAGGILFIGNRRTGKTSTLINMQPYLHSSLMVAFFDLQKPHFKATENHFAEAIYQDISKITKIAGKKNVDDFASLTDYFEQVQQNLKKQDKNLLICFDEYERLTPTIMEGKLAGLPDTMRYWIQHLDHIIFLFAGSHSVEEIEQIDWSDYLINLRTVNISYLNKNAALQLVTTPIPEFGLYYEPQSLAKEFALKLGGHPYLSQAAMFELVNILNADDSRKIAKKEDTDLSIEKMFSSTQTYFKHFWEEEINENMQKLLIQLISLEIIETEDRKALNQLLKKDIIRIVNGEYEFCVPVVKMWIERNVL